MVDVEVDSGTSPVRDWSDAQSIVFTPTKSEVALFGGHWEDSVLFGFPHPKPCW